MRNPLWIWVGVTVVSVIAGIAIAGIPDSDSSELLADSPLTTVTTTEPPPSTTAASTTTTPSTTQPAPSTTVVSTTTAPSTTAASTTTAPSTTEPAPSTTEALLDRSEIAVVVANGAAIGGVARDVADRLLDLGYVDVRTLDGSETVASSLVFGAPGTQSIAERLATDLGIDPQLVFPLSQAPEVDGQVDEPLMAYLGRDVLTLS